MEDTMDQAINQLLHIIAEDFTRWRSLGEYGNPGDADEMFSKLSVQEGRKYLKIVKTDNQETVWGFIVKEDEAVKAGSHTFKAGDILKAASWNAPARNKPRGNIIQGDFSWVRWTGPEYLA